MLSIGDRAREELDEAECARLLATAELGRLGYTQAALPAIAPVTYGMAGRRIVIPATPGSAPVTAARGAIVVFVVDTFGTGGSAGWAVTVVGPAHVVSEPGAVAALHRVTGRPHTGPPGSYLLVECRLVTGWRTTSGADRRGG